MGAVCTVSILFAISWPGAALTIREYPGPHELWSLVESVAITSLLYWWIASAKRRQAAEREAKVVTSRASCSRVRRLGAAGLRLDRLRAG